jgi:hypothetical protein
MSVLICDSKECGSIDDSRKAPTGAEVCGVHTRGKGEGCRFLAYSAT